MTDDVDIEDCWRKQQIRMLCFAGIGVALGHGAEIALSEATVLDKQQIRVASTRLLNYWLNR